MTFRVAVTGPQLDDDMYLDASQKLWRIHWNGWREFPNTIDVAGGWVASPVPAMLSADGLRPKLYCSVTGRIATFLSANPPIIDRFYGLNDPGHRLWHFYERVKLGLYSFIDQTAVRISANAVDEYMLWQAIAEGKMYQPEFEEREREASRWGYIPKSEKGNGR